MKVNAKETVRNVTNIVKKENVIQRNVILRNLSLRNVKKKNVILRNVRQNFSLWNIRKGNAKKNVSLRNVRKENAQLWNVKKENIIHRNVHPRNVRMGNMKIGIDTWPFLLLLLLAGGGSAVRITQLEVPKVALAGDDVHLRCHYQEDTNGGGLYTLKWYKDQREFFRHQPGISMAASSSRCQSDPNYHVPGVTVDCWGSTERQVVLKDVSSASTGTYQCEVIGDHPNFRKEKKQGELTVFTEKLLPPDLTQDTEGIPGTMRDHSSFYCVARNSEYTPTLTWLINGRPANQSWVRQVGQRESALEVPVRGEHFPEGVMRVDCMATLGADHSQAAHLKLLQQDHLSAQEYQYNSALSGQKTGVGLVVLVVMMVSVLAGPLVFWSPPLADPYL